MNGESGVVEVKSPATEGFIRFWTFIIILQVLFDSKVVKTTLNFNSWSNGVHNSCQSRAMVVGAFILKYYLEIPHALSNVSLQTSPRDWSLFM